MTNKRKTKVWRGFRVCAKKEIKIQSHFANFQNFVAHSEFVYSVGRFPQLYYCNVQPEIKVHEFHKQMHQEASYFLC